MSSAGRVRGLGMVLVVATSTSPFVAACSAPTPSEGPIGTSATTVHLGSVPENGGMSLDEALRSRRSVRELDSRPLDDSDIGALLWAMQGVTSDWGGRTAPSAGGTYPLEIYVATAMGLHRYLPATHALEIVLGRDVRSDLHRAGLSQDAIAQAPAVFVVAANPSRTAKIYGSRAERYVLLEAGHATQNLLLQVAALRLAAVPIGAFDDGAVADAVRLPPEQIPLYLIPVGHPREGDADGPSTTVSPR